MAKRARPPNDALKAHASIKAAERLCCDPPSELEEARGRLETATDPFPKGAVDAERLVDRARHKWSMNGQMAVRAMKKASRDLRDLVVTRCQACSEEPKNRDSFLIKVAEAYGDAFNHDVRAKILMAYHKHPANNQDPFCQRPTRPSFRPRRRLPEVTF